MLVVDDFEPWRRHVVSTLASSSKWIVAGEAVDGAQAIEKALALRPDLILLDVGLPTTNGVEAARRMLSRDATLRILFVSEHQSFDIAEAALCAGGRGYICKSDAGRELMPAMDAVVEGRRFVSARLGGRGSKAPVNGCLSHRQHQIGFYADDTGLVDHWADLAQTALNSGDAFVIVATPSTMSSVRQALQNRGVDVQRVTREGRFIATDVSKVLSEFIVDSRPDEARFWQTVVSLVMGCGRSISGSRRVVACGVCAPALWARATFDAAIRLEELWDEATRTFALDVWCGYAAGVGLDADSEKRLRELHTTVHSG